MLTVYADAEIRCDRDPCKMTPQQRSKIGDNGAVAATARTRAAAVATVKSSAKAAGFKLVYGRWLCAACRGVG